MRGSALLGALSFIVAIPAGAQMPMTEQPAAAPNCPADAEPIPAPLAGWRARKTLTAATNAKALYQIMLSPGVGADLRLAPTPTVAYVRRPDHPGGAVSYGGMLAFTADHAGTVRIAIGSGAWLDLIDASGTALVSTAHGHGPNCSGIRKMVDFAVRPGRYVIEVAGAGSPNLPIVIASLD